MHLHVGLTNLHLHTYLHALLFGLFAFPGPAYEHLFPTEARIYFLHNLFPT